MLKGTKSRDDLESALESVLEKLTFNTQTKKEIIAFLVERNYSVGLATKMITNIVYLKTLNEIELCLLTMIVYEKLENQEDKDLVYPQAYFMNYEIEKATTHKRVVETNNSSVIRLTNVTRTNPDQYNCGRVSLQLIGFIINNMLYDYNMEVQRQPTKKIRREKITKVPTIIPEKKIGIKTDILNHSMTSNDITINVPRNDKQRFSYNEESQTLEIEVDENTRFQIIDGFHRWVAISDVLEHEPKFEYNFTFNIFNTTESAASEWVLSKDKQTPFAEYHVKNLSNNDVYMVMAKDINKALNEKINVLYGRIGDDLIDTEYDKHYTTLSILSQSIRHNFDEKGILEQFEREDIQDFIIKGFGYIIGTYKKEFKFKKEEKSKSIKTYPNMFIGYVAILSKLYNDIEWKEKIKRILSELDLSKNEINTPVWESLGIFSEKLTNSNIKKMSDHFKNIVREKVEIDG
jgi:hypothetical protein